MDERMIFSRIQSRYFVMTEILLIMHGYMYRGVLYKYDNSVYFIQIATVNYVIMHIISERDRVFRNITTDAGRLSLLNTILRKKGHAS